MDTPTSENKQAAEDNDVSSQISAPATRTGPAPLSGEQARLATQLIRGTASGDVAEHEDHPARVSLLHALDQIAAGREA